MRIFTQARADRYHERVEKLAASGSFPKVPTMHVKHRDLLAGSFKAVLAYIKDSGQAADVAFMSGYTYIAFRKFARDSLDVETADFHKKPFKRGPESDFDDIPFFISNAVPEGKVWVLLQGDRDKVIEMETETFRQGHLMCARTPWRGASLQT